MALLGVIQTLHDAKFRIFWQWVGFPLNVSCYLPVKFPLGLETSYFHTKRTCGFFFGRRCVLIYSVQIQVRVCPTLSKLSINLKSVKNSVGCKYKLSKNFTIDQLTSTPLARNTFEYEILLSLPQSFSFFSFVRSFLFLIFYFTSKSVLFWNYIHTFFSTFWYAMKQPDFYENKNYIQKLKNKKKWMIIKIIQKQ